MSVKKITIAIALAGCLAGCTQTAPAPTPTAAAPSPVAATATPQPEATATPAAAAVDPAALLAEFDQRNSSFPYKEAKKVENGPVFLTIANDSSNPKEVVGALKALKNLYTSRPDSKKKIQAGEPYRAMIKKHLKSEEATIRHWAIQAAGPTLGKTPDSEVVDILVGFMTEDKEVGARYESIDILTSLNKYEDNPKVAAALLKALSDSEPAVVSIACFRLIHHSYGLADKKPYYKVAHGLLENADPGVRGRAAQLASKVAAEADKQALTDKLISMLSDKNPFVRSKAADALAGLKRTDAVVKILPLLDDTTKNTYDLKFKNLLGKDERVHHDGSPWSRVDDAALYAIQRVSNGLRDDKFKYEKVDSKKLDDDIAREAKRAKEWYQANKDKL